MPLEIELPETNNLEDLATATHITRSVIDIIFKQNKIRCSNRCFQNIVFYN